MKIAILLIDLQNGNAKPPGSFHGDAAKSANENGMLERLLKVVDAARGSGDAIVIHSPSTARAKSRPRRTYPGDCSLQENNWSSEIMDAFRPQQFDVVLSGRDHPDAPKGTELPSVIEENDVRSIILLGFLSDEALDVAIGLSDDFPSLEINACRDGTAAFSPNYHKRVMEVTLPLNGIGVITSEDALTKIEIGASSPKRAINRRNNLFEARNTSGVLFKAGKTSNILATGKEEEKLDIYEFQSQLRSTSTLIPSHVLVSVFDRAYACTDEGKIHDPFCKFTLGEIIAILPALSDREMRIEAAKATASDLPSVLNLLAGSFLLIGLFRPGDVYNLYIGWLGSSLLYMISSGSSAIAAPLNEWRASMTSERDVQEFKRSICRQAEDYESFKAECGENALAMESRLMSHNFFDLMHYIEEVIFSGKRVLTKTDMEMTLLNELGTSYTPHILHYTMKNITHKSASINACEFHLFVESSDGGRDPSRARRYHRRAWYVFKGTMMAPGYILNMCFFVGSFISVLRWFLGMLAYVETPENFGAVICWLFDIGTLGFSKMAYDDVVAAYDRKEIARALLLSSIRYAQYYNQDMLIWKQYQEKAYLDNTSLAQIFEESDVQLSDAEQQDLFQEIDTDGNGVITKREFEEYLEANTNRQGSILGKCLRDFNFLANLSWFAGAIFYTVAYYFTGAASNMGTAIGASGYFLGGLAYCAMTYSKKKKHLLVLVKLQGATKRLIRDNKHWFGCSVPMPNISEKDEELGPVPRRTLLQANFQSMSSLRALNKASYGLDEQPMAWIKSRRMLQPAMAASMMSVLQEEADESELESSERMVRLKSRRMLWQSMAALTMAVPQEKEDDSGFKSFEHSAGLRLPPKMLQQLWRGGARPVIAMREEEDGPEIESLGLCNNVCKSTTAVQGKDNESEYESLEHSVHFRLPSRMLKKGGPSSVIAMRGKEENPELEFSALSGHVHKSTTARKEDNSELESESDPESSVFSSRIHKFLSRMISYASMEDYGKISSLTKLELSSSSPVAGSLLMYRLTLSDDDDEYAGLLYIYPSCCNTNYMKKMTAKFSIDGTKVLINFPAHSPNEGVGEFNLMMPSELEVILPSEEATGYVVIGAPTVIYSHAKTQSMIHFQLGEAVNSVE